MIRLTDEQWKRIRDHFPEEHIADGRPGRKPTPTRCVLEAVLWILNTGAQWHMLPQRSQARLLPQHSLLHRAGWRGRPPAPQLRLPPPNRLTSPIAATRAVATIMSRP